MVVWMRPGLRNFGWLLEERLAGSGALVEGDIPWLHKQGVRSVVCLRETPMEPELFEEAGVRYTDMPIPDFGAPTDEMAPKFVRHLTRELEEGRPVLVHCNAGLGRTGTMMAIFLVSQGYPASEAIETVRDRRPGSITHPEQERAVLRYHRLHGAGQPGRLAR